LIPDTVILDAFVASAMPYMFNSRAPVFLQILLAAMMSISGSASLDSCGKQGQVADEPQEDFVSFLQTTSAAHVGEHRTHMHGARSGSSRKQKAAKLSAHQRPQCQCMPNNVLWQTTDRTVPKCIFIDLGAGSGDSFESFLGERFGSLQDCPSGQWEAWLVEANPQFTNDLSRAEAKFPGQVHPLSSTAAYMCAGETSFFVDHEWWVHHQASSMTGTNPVFEQTGKTKITVPMVNVVQLINENTIPEDTVILKVDIEGAEYDVIPCLAQNTKAGLVDRLFLEEHTWFETGFSNGPQEMLIAKDKLRSMNVSIPDYFSPTL